MTHNSWTLNCSSSKSEENAILLPFVAHLPCGPGFYFPDVTSEAKYYNGSILEEEYEKKLMVSY